MDPFAVGATVKLIHLGNAAAFNQFLLWVVNNMAAAISIGALEPATAKDTGALLEKRNLYTTKDGQERMGKAKGFNLAETAYIVEHWKEIQGLL